MKKKQFNLNRKLKDWFRRKEVSNSSMQDLTRRFTRIRNRLFLPKFLRHMKRLGIGGLSAGNDLQLINDGDQCFKQFMKDIDSAKLSVNLETYIFSSDEVGWQIAKLLARKAKEGVEVNIIYDAIGSLATSPQIFTFLKENGAELIEYHPLMPWRRYWNIHVRDHRKILVIDGRTAFVGGINISKAYAGSEFNGEGWRDTHLRIEGPAVRDVQFSFLETWYRNGGDIVDESHHFPFIEDAGNYMVMILRSTARKKVKPIKEAYLSAIENARHSIYITNAYFVPTSSVLNSLMKASERGVEVKLLLPEYSDVKMVQYAGRYLYKRYLKNKIRIYEYGPAMLHAKTAVIDGFWSTVGSSNLDGLSFRRNLEINAVVLDQDFGESMENEFMEDLKNSKEIKIEKWERRSILNFIIEWFFYRFRNYL